VGPLSNHDRSPFTSTTSFLEEGASKTSTPSLERKINRQGGGDEDAIASRKKYKKFCGSASTVRINTSTIRRRKTGRFRFPKTESSEERYNIVQQYICTVVDYGRTLIVAVSTTSLLLSNSRLMMLSSFALRSIHLSLRGTDFVLVKMEQCRSSQSFPSSFSGSNSDLLGSETDRMLCLLRDKSKHPILHLNNRRKGTAPRPIRHRQPFSSSHSDAFSNRKEMGGYVFRSHSRTGSIALYEASKDSENILCRR
jgi:hypothetical protein